MSFFAGIQEHSADDYQKLRQQVIDAGKQGYVQSEINRYLVGNPYLTEEIIKLIKIEMMKKTLEMQL